MTTCVRVLGARGPILLDIDLDYFANDYDDKLPHGDGGRPDDGSVVTAINEFVAGVADAHGAPRVEAVTVAASPGFFPRSTWDRDRATIVEPDPSVDGAAVRAAYAGAVRL